MSKEDKYFLDEDIKAISDWLKNKTPAKKPKDSGTQKLKTTWTMEMAQDLESFFGIDVEKEMEEALKKSIVEETIRKSI